MKKEIRKALRNIYSQLDELQLDKVPFEKFKSGGIDEYSLKECVQSSERALEVCSTYLFADKLAKKKSVSGLAHLVESLDRYEGDEVRIIDLDNEHLSCTFYLKLGDNMVLGYLYRRGSASKVVTKNE